MTGIAAYTLCLVEGKLIATSPETGDERELVAPTMWNMREGALPWTFRADQPAMFTVVAGSYS